MRAYGSRIDWRGEAWPSRARLEFGVACEQRRSAAGAAVHPDVVIIPVFAGKSPLGAGLAQNIILIGRQWLAPFAFGLPSLARETNLVAKPRCFTRDLRKLAESMGRVKANCGEKRC